MNYHKQRNASFLSVMKGHLWILICIAVPVMTSCDDEEPVKKIGADDLKFQVEFDPLLGQTVYPSIILALANFSGQEENGLELIKYSVTNPETDSKLKIVLSSSTVNDESVLQETLATNGQSYSFNPAINWDYEKLKTLDQPGNTNLSFTAFINDQETDTENFSISYRSVNECVYGVIDEQGVYVDLKWMFAAYVNEDHPKIDEFLEEVLDTDIVNSFNGYQGSSDNVYHQVYAIWYALQLKGVKYSSITDTSNPSQKIFTQHVRFFDQVYNNTQANCVDGSVFLSSILKKIGIEPFLVLIPGHMYIGFYLDEDRSSFALLETTMIGHINLEEIYEEGNYVYNLEKYYNYLTQETLDGYFNGDYSLDYVEREISWYSFQFAVSQNIEQWNDHIDDFNDENNHDYQALNISELRQIVQPIGR